MRERWTDELDKRLLLEMFNAAGSPAFSSDQWSAIAAKLGEGYTGSGVSQRYRKQIKKLVASSGSTAGTPKAKAPRTPASGKSKNATPRGSTTGGSKRKERSENHNEEDDEETKEVAAKRQRNGTANDDESPIKIKDEDSELDFKTCMDMKSEGEDVDFFA